MLDRFKFWVHKPKKYNVKKTSVRVTFSDSSTTDIEYEGFVTYCGGIFESLAVAETTINRSENGAFFKINGNYVNVNQIKTLTVLKTVDFEVEQ